MVLAAEDLLDEFWRRKSSLPDPLALRVYRAISWLKRSEQEKEDPDAAFLFQWVSFNACYADDEVLKRQVLGEKGTFRKYFSLIIALDDGGRIRDVIVKRFSSTVHDLIDNRYVFPAFWHYYNGIDNHADWKPRFDESRKSFLRAFLDGNMKVVLDEVFERLYILRNQMMHGGATWNSSVNRVQVKAAADFLGFLLPIFIDIMLDNPNEDWGRPYYPVVQE